MPFVLTQKDRYKWPVKVQIARENGKYDTYEFFAEFNRMPQSWVDDLQRRVKAGDPVTDDEVIDKILTDWSGIKTPEQEEVPFCELNKKIVLDIAGVRGAIVNAFFNSLDGALRKN